MELPLGVETKSAHPSGHPSGLMTFVCFRDVFVPLGIGVSAVIVAAAVVYLYKKRPAKG